MLQVTDTLAIPEQEWTWQAVRSSGPGGQNVNKVASAVHLRFDIPASSIPEAVKRRLLASGDGRISDAGVLMIKAQSHRTQERNRQDALERLADVVRAATVRPRRRIATRPTRASKKRRLESKKRRGDIKRQRRKDW